MKVIEVGQIKILDWLRRDCNNFRFGLRLAVDLVWLLELVGGVLIDCRNVIIVKRFFFFYVVTSVGLSFPKSD